MALFKRDLKQATVIVVATQGRVTTGGEDLEHATAHAQNRNIKGAATQVVNRIHAFTGIVQTISNGGSSGFVDQAQHIQARHLRCVFGGLALRVIKVRWHGDDRAVDVVIEGVFCALAQAGQNLRTHLYRRLQSMQGVQAQHAGLVCKRIREMFGVGHVFQTAPHKTLDRDDGVGRVLRLRNQRSSANQSLAIWQIAHYRRQDHMASFIGQALGNAVAHAGHQGMGGTQVDANGDPSGVGIWCLTRFGNLQQSHGGYFALRHLPVDRGGCSSLLRSVR